MASSLRARGFRHRLGVGIASLAALVLAVTGLMLGVALSQNSAQREVAREVALARRARALGIFAREQYIHEAHTILLGDRSHVRHHGVWAARFRAETQALEGELPTSERAGLDAIVSQSAALEAAFVHEIVPAVERRDHDAVHRGHDRVESLVDAMTSGADALGDRIEARARATSARATRTLRVGVALSLSLSALGVLLAIVVSRRLWSAVATPLGRLHSVAERVAAGDVTARVGPVAPLELAIVGAAFDQMLDRLVVRERRLVEAERLAVIGRLAAGVAHEINNPIGVIRGYVKVMRAEAVDEGLRAELAILDEEALGCQRIVEDLLAYARGPMLDRRAVAIESLAEETVARLRTSGELGDRAVRIEVAPRTLSLDPLRMRQVLANLLRNAAQASPPDAAIDLTGRTEGEDYVLSVADRGEGVSAPMRARLFEPFATTRAGGTGLGLAVCEGIVHAHNGSIEIEGRSGGGAVFVVRLPPEAQAT